jgi:hypothetical protein
LVHQRASFIGQIGDDVKGLVVPQREAHTVRVAVAVFHTSGCGPNGKGLWNKLIQKGFSRRDCTSDLTLDILNDMCGSSDSNSRLFCNAVGPFNNFCGLRRYILRRDG